jgi:hypothetical protein
LKQKNATKLSEQVMRTYRFKSVFSVKKEATCHIKQVDCLIRIYSIFACWQVTKWQKTTAIGALASKIEENQHFRVAIMQRVK